MSSQVAVANRTMIKVGAEPITSIDEQNKRASTIKALWDDTRRTELSKHFWKFAIKRVQLPALTNAPTFGFALAYQLPPDYIKMVQVGDVFDTPGLSDFINSDTAMWHVEGKTIATDLPAPLNVRYIADITDVSLWEPQFVEAMASKLGYDGAYRITGSDSRQQACGMDYKAALRDAVLADMLEDPPESLPDSTWMLARA